MPSRSNAEVFGSKDAILLGRKHTPHETKETKIRRTTPVPPQENRISVIQKKTSGQKGLRPQNTRIVSEERYTKSKKGIKERKEEGEDRIYKPSERMS
jgi:hypothetical protein